MDNFLISHILLEFLSGDNDGLLVEQFFDPSEKKILLEKYGCFDGCVELANAISYRYADFVSQLNHSIISKKSFVVNTNNSFVHDVIVELNANLSVGNLGYLFNSGIIGNDGKFEHIKIIIGIKEKVPNSIPPSVISHELQHAYEDWKLKSNGSALNKKKDSKLYVTNNSSIPQKEVLKKLKNVLYMFNKSEVSAYINAISASIPETDEKCLSVEEILTQVRKTPYVKYYDEVFADVDEITTCHDDNTQKLILSYINNLFAQSYNLKTDKFKTFNQFSKWLKKQTFIVKRKLSKTIPKIVHEKLKGNVNKMMQPSKNIFNS